MPQPFAHPPKHLTPTPVFALSPCTSHALPRTLLDHWDSREPMETESSEFPSTGVPVQPGTQGSWSRMCQIMILIADCR